MRIKSSFTDYYDIGMGLGYDDSILYIREPKEVEHKPYLFKTNLCWQTYLKHRAVGFCGIVYPLLVIQNNIDTPSHYCYNLENVDKAVETLFSKDQFESYMGNARNHKQYFFLRRNEVRDFFHLMESTRNQYKNLFEHNPLFLAEWGRSRTSCKITYNARLRDVQFMRIFSPYEAYQEISMFLSNMAQPEKPIPTVSDEELLTAKGFDKYSFRKSK